MAVARTRSKAAKKSGTASSSSKKSPRKTSSAPRGKKGRTKTIKSRQKGSSFRQIGLISCITAMAFATLSLLTYSHDDPGLFRSHSGETQNVAGPLGAWLADLLLYLFGYGSCVVVFLMVVFGLKLAGRAIGGTARLMSGLMMMWATLSCMSLLFPYFGRD